jgi:hypothetical protein
MRTLGQLSFLGTLLTSMAFLAGCGGGGPGPDGVGAAPGTGGSGAGVGTGGGSSTGGATGTGGTNDPTVCIPGVPQTTQFPLLTRRQYDNVVRDLLGVTTLANGVDKPSTLLNPDFEGPINSYAWSAFLNAGETIAAQVMADATLRAKFINCDPATAGCLTDTITAFGRKAFRRPLTAEDIARFEKLSTDAATATPPGTPEEVAEATLNAFLVSPSFLTISELVLGTPLPEDQARQGDIKLSSHEVAARLSFLLWGSVPDDELNAAADAGALTTKAQILTQAQRMVGQGDKVSPQILLALRAWADMDNDNSHWWSTLHPEFGDTTMATLSQEIDLFFAKVALGGGSFADLFLDPVAFVNQDTAALYDLDPADYGTELEEVALDQTTRPGFLTRAGFLASFAHADATSPIWRGAYITLRMIGFDPGPPSENALTTKAPDMVYTSQRQYTEVLTSGAECVGCHSTYVNPPGFVLENFDVVGKWQPNDPLGDPINPNVNMTIGGASKPISNPLQLMTEIATSDSGRRNFAERVTSFATGRLPNSNDACVVEQLKGSLAADGYTVLNLLTDLTQADSLRLRTRGL